MIRRTPRSTRTDTLFPYTTLFRSLFVAKTELSRGVPFVSYVLRHSGAALIDRGNSRQALKAIADMARLVHREKLRSEEHTSELQSLMRISYAVFCLKTKKHYNIKLKTTLTQLTQTHSHTIIN